MEVIPTKKVWALVVMFSFFCVSQLPINNFVVYDGVQEGLFQMFLPWICSQNVTFLRKKMVCSYINNFIVCFLLSFPSFRWRCFRVHKWMFIFRRTSSRTYKWKQKCWSFKSVCGWTSENQPVFTSNYWKFIEQLFCYWPEKEPWT